MDFDLDKMYCGKIRRGDLFIYEVNDEEKLAVVLQDDILNEGLPTVVCAMVEPYKAGEEVFPNEVILEKKVTGLDKDGICMLHKIITVDRRKMIAKKGELSQEKMVEVLEALDVNLGRFRDR